MKNTAILEGAKDEIFTQLCKNNLLLSMYPKKELRRRIDQNIQTIYTNIVDDRKSGWCELERPVIAICTEDKDAEPLTIEEVKKDKKILEVLIHEAIHAILKHKNGTGILNRKKVESNSKSTFKEIGRGINEGYTNWLVEKCKIETNSYSFLTSINKQLEICIGPNNMMKLSKGNLQQIYKILNMDIGYGTEFLRQLDDIYNAEKRMNEIENIEMCLSEKISSLSGEKDEEKRYFDDVSSLKIFRMLFENILDTENLDIERYNQALDRLQKEFKEPENLRLLKLKEIAEAKIINSLVTDKMDCPESISEYTKLIDLMSEIKCALEQKTSFKAFENLRDKVKEQAKILQKKVFEEIDIAIQKGNFTPEFLKAELYKINALVPQENEKGITIRNEKTAKIIASRSKNKKEDELLLRYMIETDSIDNAENLTIKRTKSNKGIIYENGKVKDVIIDGITFFIEETDKELHEGEVLTDKWDWTVQKSTDLQLIISEFERLKKEKMEQNPNVKISIINTIIVFSDEFGEEIYDIIQGENSGIKKVEFETEKPVRSMLDDNKYRVEQKPLVPITTKNTFMRDIKRKLQQFLHKRKNKQDNQDNGIIVGENELSTKNTFEERIKLGINNKEATTTKIKDNSTLPHEHEIEEQEQ